MRGHTNLKGRDRLEKVAADGKITLILLTNLMGRRDEDIRKTITDCKPEERRIEKPKLRRIDGELEDIKKED